MIEETLEAPPEGFKSAEAKKSFTIGALVVAVVGSMAPMVIPIFMMPVMIAVPFFANERGSAIEIPLRESAYWNDRVWFIDENEAASASPAGASGYVLKSIAEGAPADQVRVESTFVAMDKPQLVASEDRLWIISESSLGYVDDRAFSFLPASARRGELSVPFLVEGKPAALELLPHRTSLLVVDGDAWKIRSSGRLSASEGQFSMNQVRGVQSAGSLVLFLKMGATIFTAEWKPEGEREPSWTSLARTDSYLDVASIADRPTVFYYQEGRLRSLQRRDGAWSSFCDLDMKHQRNMRVFPGVHPGTAVMVRYANRQLTWSDISEGILVDRSTNDARPVARRKMIPKIVAGLFLVAWCLFMLLMLTMPLALAVLMKKYRTSEYRFGDRTVEYASLWRRGIAASIDSLLVALPILAGLTYIGWRIWPIIAAKSELPPTFAWAFMGIVAGAFLITILGQILWSFMEGRWGVTPGKRLCRIQVLNLELKPCGFWRAFVRRLLLLADSFFSYLVGMMLIAFTPKWQRLGDLAVGTIVVRRS